MLYIYNIIITYHEPPNQLPFVPDQVFPTSGCCQLGAARLFTSCCRSSSGGNSTGEPARNPNKCGEFSHDVDFISWKDRIPCFLVKRLWRFFLANGLAKQTWTSWTNIICCKMHEHRNIHFVTFTQRIGTKRKNIETDLGQLNKHELCKKVEMSVEKNVQQKH